MNVLVVDNYDSFTYNLVQYLGELGQDVRVVRNDGIAAAEIAGMGPSHIVISPGPCTPNEAGISMETIKTYAGKIPILGVCLGHQAIGQAFGGRIVHAAQLMHGKVSAIHHDRRGVFTGIPDGFTATRYHSLVVERTSMPRDLTVNAESADRLVMGLMHNSLPAHGVQFHPESIASEHGHLMLRNFLEAAAAWNASRGRRSADLRAARRV